MALCAGQLVSAGFNVATDQSCKFTLPSDRPGTLPLYAEAEHRKGQLISSHAEEPSPPVDSGFAWTIAEGQMAQAFAAYLSDDPNLWATADAEIVALEQLGYPTKNDGGWIWGEFTSPLLFRLAAISDDAWSHVGAGTGGRPDARSLVITMVKRFVDKSPLNCNYADEWGSLTTPDPWLYRGTENHDLVRRTNCLLGLYILRNQTGYNNPSASNKKYWTYWADILGQFLEERSRNGLLNEVHSPEYAGISLMTIYNLADFPTTTTLGAELHREGRAFLDLYWHDVAHAFSAGTGVVSAGSHRTYQFDPDGPEPTSPSQQGYDFVDASDSIFVQWTRMYDWHSQPIDMSLTDPQVLAAADSDYNPLEASRVLAQYQQKSYEYSSMRPTLADVTSAQLYSQGGNLLRRDVSANSSYIMGALTYGPDTWHTGSESRTFSATINEQPNDRILVSGIADDKPSQPGVFADYFSLQGVVTHDAMIAGRNYNARQTPVNCPEDPEHPWKNPNEFWEQTDCDGNSRGVRVYLGNGQLRTNLEVPADPAGWYFTRTNGTFAAIRVPDSNISVIHDTNGNVRELRLDNLADGTGTADIWRPLVIQMAPAAAYSGNFGSFKSAVAARTFVSNASGVSYQTLSGQTLSMDRQQSVASVPSVNGTPVSVTPSYAYDSPYFSMAWNTNSVAPIATLSAPDVSPVTVDVDWSP